MHYYETTHRDTLSDYPVTTAHETLDDAITFADQHGITLISEMGECFDEWGKCWFCGEWFLIEELNDGDECSRCEQAIKDHGG